MENQDDCIFCLVTSGLDQSLGSWVILSEKGENEIPFHSADALTGFQMMDEFKILVTI